VIFVDTSAFLARYLARDQNHRAASEVWRRLETEEERLLTSNFVLDELFTLLARRSSYAYSARRARVVMASRRLEILRPDEEIEIAALDLFEKFADQKISFTDCTSFALMRSKGLRRVFAFDRHFTFAGFELIPTAV